MLAKELRSIADRLRRERLAGARGRATPEALRMFLLPYAQKGAVTALVPHGVVAKAFGLDACDFECGDEAALTLIRAFEREGVRCETQELCVYFDWGSDDGG